MSENETIAEIRKETEPRFRELLEKHVDSLGHIQAMQQFNQVFDRIEAVEKRERVETATRAATSAINLTDEKWKGEIGNMAKLREALQTIRSNIYRDQSGDLHIAPDIIVEEVIDRALAEPPRNCDVYDKEEVRMAYHLQGDGLMTMQAVVDWLYSAKKRGDESPRTEQESGAQG